MQCNLRPRRPFLAEPDVTLVGNPPPEAIKNASLDPQAPTVEACRSMPQHTENWVGVFFGKKCRTKISIPSLCSYLSEMDSAPVVKWGICD